MRTLSTIRAGTLFVLLPLVVFGGLSAQAVGSSVAAVVANRELEYQAARSEYTAAYDVWEVYSGRWNQLVDSHAAAYASGNEDRLVRILAEAQGLSGQVTQAKNRVEDLRSAWVTAGLVLVGALDAHLELLEIQAQSSRPESQSDIAIMYRDRDNRLREVEDELGPIRRNLVLRPLPQVTIGPRDGPQEIRFKAQLLTRKVAQHESWILDINEEIEDLQHRQRRNRSFQDFAAGLERWDDTQVPVTAGAPRAQIPEDGLETTSDSTAVVVTRSLEGRIQDLEIFREALEERRDQLKEKAQLFLGRAGGSIGHD